MKKSSFLEKTRNLLILSIVLVLVSSCSTKYNTAFVVVREADFRVGPVSLPLNQEDKEKIELFLLKGGDNSIQDFVEPSANIMFQELFEKLADPGFLMIDNFRNPGEIDKVSEIMRTWFEEPIVYQLIDATQKRPPLINPICMTDGRYWWVFYMGHNGGAGGGFRIKKLLVTVSPSKILDHYGEN
jgi:hypothetical protein